MPALNREKLKATRKGMKLTQEKLAERAGTTDRTIRYIENEKTTPSTNTLHKICETLHLTVDSVLDGKEDEHEE